MRDNPGRVCDRVCLYKHIVTERKTDYIQLYRTISIMCHPHQLIQIQTLHLASEAHDKRMTMQFKWEVTFIVVQIHNAGLKGRSVFTIQEVGGRGGCQYGIDEVHRLCACHLDYVEYGGDELAHPSRLSRILQPPGRMD